MNQVTLQPLLRDRCKAKSNSQYVNESKTDYYLLLEERAKNQ